MVELRRRALFLYMAPFKYEHGYIWDAKREMVADGAGRGLVELLALRQASLPPPTEDELAALRVRGWGRIQHVGESIDDAANLQDTVGELIAEALTQYWQREIKNIRVADAIESSMDDDE